MLEDGERRAAADEDARADGRRQPVVLQEEEQAGADGAALREHHQRIVGSVRGDVAAHPGDGGLCAFERLRFDVAVVRGRVEEVDARGWGAGVFAVEEVEGQVEVC